MKGVEEGGREGEKERERERKRERERERDLCSVTRMNKMSGGGKSRHHEQPRY